MRNALAAAKTNKILINFSESAICEASLINFHCNFHRDNECIGVCGGYVISCIIFLGGQVEGPAFEMASARK